MNSKPKNSTLVLFTLLKSKEEYFKMVVISQIISEKPKKSQIPISKVSITVENSSFTSDTTSKTTEGTNSTTTEDYSIEDLQKEIEINENLQKQIEMLEKSCGCLEKKLSDERLKSKLLVAKWISEGGMSAFSLILKMIFGIVAILYMINITHGDVNRVVDDFIPTRFEITFSFNVVMYTIGIFIQQFMTVQAFRALLQNPTKEISRKFGHDLFYNLSISPLMIINLMTIFVCRKYVNFLYHIIFICWISLFFLNLILWTFSHIALYYKSKSVDGLNQTPTRDLTPPKAFLVNPTQTRRNSF